MNSMFSFYQQSVVNAGRGNRKQELYGGTFTVAHPSATGLSLENFLTIG